MSDTQKHIKPNVPTLRFPGFEGEWERIRLAYSCDVYDGTHQTPKYTKTGVPFLSVEDITALRDVEKKYISEEAFQRDFKISPQKGDILMTRIGDIGTSIVIEENKPIAYYVSLALIRPHEIDSAFLNSYIASPFFKRELYRRTIHVAFPKKINKEDIGECLFTYPQVNEQKKIGRFLALLDQRIDVQNKVIEKYESLIKALYARLIPEDGDNHVALGTLVLICKGKQLNGEFLSDDGKYYVMNGGITPSGYYEEYNTPAGTISISEGGNSCGFVQYNEEPFWSGGHCYTLLQTRDERIQYKFLYHFLKSRQDEIMSLRIGSGLPNIQKKDIGKFTVPILPLDYQKAITRLFDSIGKRIEYEQTLLVELALQKNYFLGSMFI